MSLAIIFSRQLLVPIDVFTLLLLCMVGFAVYALLNVREILYYLRQIRLASSVQ